MSILYPAKLHCIIHKMHPYYSTLLTLSFLFLLVPMSCSATTCRDECGTLQIHYPFGVDDGCGAPQFRNMFTCNSSSQSLFFVTPNGNFKVQSIDYNSQTITVYDPDMSTCTILQPHHDLRLSDIQYAIIPPSPDTVFALLNCSVDSPVLNRYRSLCFDVAGHKCEELYSSCNSFRVFTSPDLLTPGITNNNTGPNGYFYAGGNNNYNYNYNNNNNVSGGGFGTGGGTGIGTGTGTGGGVSGGIGTGTGGGIGTGTGVSGGGIGTGTGGGGLSGGTGTEGGGSITPPPCCFTGYSTVKVMSMDILDCTHFTSFYNADKLRGVGPMDWSYGLKFSYSVPDMGCERCAKSGGSCGFDAETEALMCLCSAAVNSTRQCGIGTDMDAGELRIPSTFSQAFIIVLGLLFLS